MFVKKQKAEHKKAEPIELHPIVTLDLVKQSLVGLGLVQVEPSPNSTFLIRRKDISFFIFRESGAHLDRGGARTIEIGPIRNQNLIFWPLANAL